MPEREEKEMAGTEKEEGTELSLRSSIEPAPRLLALRSFGKLYPAGAVPILTSGAEENSTPW